MSITYENTQITTLTYGNESVNTATYHNVVVFQRNASVDIYGAFTISASSVAPPPYDENGYNYNEAAPLSATEQTINLGDITNYDYIVIKWDNEGTYVPYGIVSATATINEQSVTLFNGGGYAKSKTKINVSELSGTYSLKVKVTAKSSSPYRGYACRSMINVSYVQGMIGSGEPPAGVTFPDFTVGTAVSYAPPPYRGSDFTEQYNIYGDCGAPQYITHTLDLGDVTNYSTLTFTWDTWNTNDPTDVNKAWSGIGSRVVAYYEDPKTHNNVSLFDDETHSSSNRITDDVTIDLSQLSGNASLKVTVGAISGNDYRPYGANCILYVTDISMT